MELRYSKRFHGTKELKYDKRKYLIPNDNTFMPQYDGVCVKL